ncbi:MAG: DUF72 domain-containing protein [Candidatus Tumulicola sp.]
MIYVGTCGFSYKDWIGPFYPAKTKPAEMLPFYAREFCAVEIDSSYYGVPAPRTVESMAARTPAGFRFSFKVPQTITHVPNAPPFGRVHADARAFAESLKTLATAGKLACVLAQFPNGFKPAPDAEAYVERVIAAFEEFPVVVEFRNRFWQRAETMELLRALGAGYSNVDMPHLDSLLGPSSDVTASVGYVRFHGRNAKTWWRGSNVTRYDYAYSPEELVPWADRIAEIEAQTAETYVFFNNHANGQAPRNAEMIEALLERRYGDDAESALARAPRDRPVQRALPGLRDE